MIPERDLARLLATLDARREPGVFVYASVADAAAAAALPARAVVVEHEGTTVVLERGAALAHGIPFEGEWAWITLGASSALDAVGLTAAVARALAEAGIACNVLAGLYHDHLLVPLRHADAALAALARLGNAPCT